MDRLKSFTLIVLAYAIPITQSQFNFTLSPYSLPKPMWCHASAIYNDELILIDRYPNTYSTKLNPYNGSWTNSSHSNPSGIAYFLFYQGQVQVDHLVYLINPTSGVSYYPPRSFMYIYHLLTNSITTATPPLEHGEVGCSVYDSSTNLLYYMGGLLGNFEFSNSLQIYNITNDSWAYGSPMPQSKDFQGCEMDYSHQYIYDFGGHTGGSMMDTINRYNISNDSWETLSAKLSTIRWSLVCKLLPANKLIYCMGGMSADVFDTETETIIGTIHLNQPRSEFQANIYCNNSCMIVSGGESDQNHYLDSIEYLGNCGCFNGVYVTQSPTTNPTDNPTNSPTYQPSNDPTTNPTAQPTNDPTNNPTIYPTTLPTTNPSTVPTYLTTHSQIGKTTNTIIIIVVLVSVVSVMIIMAYVRYRKKWKSSKEIDLLNVSLEMNDGLNTN